MPREWVIETLDGYRGLQLQGCEAEAPGPTDVRLRIEAFALNWGDNDLMQGLYSFEFPSFPARVGIEAAGIVEAVGSDVKGVTVGERYSTLPYFYYNRGCSAESVLIDQAYITPAPKNLTAVEAASVWMQFLTAYYPMVELTDLRQGKNVFIPAGTSTAGNAAIQIAKMQGATVISSTRSATNVDYLTDSGADFVFIDDGADIAEFLDKTTKGAGVDASFDPVGGDFMDSYALSMAKNGNLFFYGGLRGSFPAPPYVGMLQKNLWLHAYSVFNYVQDDEACKRGTKYVYDALSSGQLKASVDKVFPMEGYRDAWEYLLGDRSSYGKVVIETGL